MRQILNLEDNLLWQDANYLAEYIYGILPDMPSSEEFDTTSKLRHSSNDLLFAAAQAVGSTTAPVGTAYEWSIVIKYAAGLKTIYRFACKQGFIRLEPDVMVKLENVIKQASIEIDKAHKKTKLQEENELKPWLEKYRLWKEMQQ